MDSYEATRTVLSRIHSLEADNATKIMGYLLLKDYGEKEMIRFALGPDTIIHNLIFEAKTQLGLLTKSPSTPSSPFIPFSRPNPLSLSSSPKITNNAFDFKNPSSNTWSLSGFSVSRSLNNQPISPSSFPSYASVLNRSSDSGSRSLSSPKVSSSFTSHNSSSVTHDEYLIQNDLSFLNDSKVEDLYDSRVEFSSNTDTNCKNLHNPNDYSVPEMLLGAEDLNSGFEWKPCLYFARGFCKNGSSCRFLHEYSTVDGAATVGPPNNNLNELEQCQELLRLKYAAQRLKLGSETPFVTGTSLPYNNCLNFHMQQVDNQRSATTAFEVGDELQKFGQCRIEGNEFSGMNLGGSLSPASRQIYLTFPADSTFREEDVSNYFSLYGPVQDVRIPYQQKRMFGFVTFVYSETVKLILAKGNPHFVCDSRVLVKPYKEKGKLLEKKQQHLERGDYSLCSSPTTPNCIDSYDLSHGARMYYNAQEVLLMKTLEEKANFQQAIDLQERRLINLQLLELKNNNYRRQQYHHGLSSGSPIPSPTLSQTFNHRASIIELNGTYKDVPEENNLSPVSTIPQTSVVDGDQQQQQQVNAGCNNSGVYDDKIGTEYFKTEESELHRRVEHVLPHNLFSSPEKSSGDDNNFSSASNNNSDLSSNSTLNIVSPETVFSKCPGYHLLGLEPLECN